jgi:hypothetical protein
MRRASGGRIRIDFSNDSGKIDTMSFPMNATSPSIALIGDEGLYRTFGTIGITTTHAAVRGT